MATTHTDVTSPAVGVTGVSTVTVFTDTAGRHGNALGVRPDSAGLDDAACQDIAARVGFSETVFVDDAAAGRCRIFTPAVQLPFAGHPLVGLAWWLDRDAGAAGAALAPSVLRPPAGEVVRGRDGDDWWVRAPAAWCPPWRLVELDSPAAVDAVEARGDDTLDVVWAWSDRATGAVRSRVFAAAVGVGEDQATGSAAIPLAVALGRPVVITQGRGSRLVATPEGDGAARVGGRVVEGRSA